MRDEFEVTVNVSVKDKLVIDAIQFIAAHCEDDNDLVTHAALVGLVCEELTQTEVDPKTVEDTVSRIAATMADGL